MLSEVLSAILGAVIATIGGFFVIRSVTDRQTRHGISSTLAVDYMARYSAPGYIEIRDEVDVFLNTLDALSTRERDQRLAEVCRRADPDNVRIFNRLHALAMLFAEMGVGFQRGSIDAEGLAIFDRILPHYWQALSPFIAAAHREFGFPVDDTRPLADQPLVLFSKFAYAYNEMTRRGIARERPPHGAAGQLTPEQE
jgi:hypothetical protein